MSATKIRDKTQQKLQRFFLIIILITICSIYYANFSRNSITCLYKKNIARIHSLFRNESEFKINSSSSTQVLIENTSVLINKLIETTNVSLNSTPETSELNSTHFNNLTSVNSLLSSSSLQVSNDSLILNQTNLCPLIPRNLSSNTRRTIKLDPLPLSTIQELVKKDQNDLALGGRWAPKTCEARYKVAIVIPYRDREDNLKIFLNNIHPFLSKQQLEYGIYLIEPIANVTFNRGLLMNIGFVEALKDDNDWQCFTFHDVDLIPEDDRNFYSCPETPRHMSSAVSTLDYKLPYETIFGGVTEFTREQFEDINGFSNLFFGWGGEDDDLRERVVKKGYTVSRYPLEIGRYYMAKHVKDRPNPNRFNLLKSSDKRIKNDGVSTLKYEINSITKNILYTKVVVSYNEKEILSTNTN